MVAPSGSMYSYSLVYTRPFRKASILHLMAIKVVWFSITIICDKLIYKQCMLC